MVNIGKEWRWMDDKENNSKDNKKSKVENKSTFKEEEWCHYGGLPSPMAYMDE